jgi:hypothetical protein
MTHDPHHVAHLAAMILSGRPETPEAHHIKAAVSAARAVMDEADRQAIGCRCGRGDRGRCRCRARAGGRGSREAGIWRQREPVSEATFAAHHGRSPAMTRKLLTVDEFRSSVKHGAARPEGTVVRLATAEPEVDDSADSRKIRFVFSTAPSTDPATASIRTGWQTASFMPIRWRCGRTTAIRRRSAAPRTSGRLARS